MSVTPGAAVLAGLHIISPMDTGSSLKLASHSQRASSITGISIKMVSRCTIQLFVVLLVAVSMARGRPAKALDAVDTCLFACDYCFKGDSLLLCANECLSRGGEMSHAWLETCPVFGKPLYFD